MAVSGTKETVNGFVEIPFNMVEQHKLDRTVEWVHTFRDKANRHHQTVQQEESSCLIPSLVGYLFIVKKENNYDALTKNSRRWRSAYTPRTPRSNIMNTMLRYAAH